MSEREKKAFNEAPSDPRRRRRTSESSKSNEQQIQGKRPNLGLLRHYLDPMSY